MIFEIHGQNVSRTTRTAASLRCGKLSPLATPSETGLAFVRSALFPKPPHVFAVKRAKTFSIPAKSGIMPGVSKHK
jgi:hypothetical protein